MCSSRSRSARLVFAILIFCPAALAQGGTWTSGLGAMPTPRAQLAVGAVNGFIYAIGGSGPGGYSAAVERYDPVSHGWTGGLAPMPTLRTMSGTNGAVVNGKIYAIGGNASGQCSNANEEYNPASNQWASRAPLPTPRCHLAVVALNGRVYAIGGTVTSGAFNYSIVERYDPATNSWASVASMQTPRSGPAAAAINGKIYVVGGSNPGGVWLTSVEEYDPAANTWTFRAAMPMARNILGVGALNGVLYAFGGYNGSTLGAAEAFYPAANYWTTLAPMPTPQSGLQAVAVGCSLYTVGGADATPYYPAVSAFTPDALVISAPTGPGSLRIDNFFCEAAAASTYYVMAVTANAPQSFPNGWFYGVAIPPPVLGAQISQGVPFSGLLSVTGTSSFTIPSGVPSGLLLNAVTVAVTPGSLALAALSSPVAFTTP